NIIFVLFLYPGFGQNPDGFDQLIKDTLSFTIPTVSIQELKDAQVNQKQSIILDTREKNEYLVSHIRGAINVGYDDFNMNALNGVPKNTKIFVYCSIGYRSELIGEQLKTAGFL